MFLFFISSLSKLNISAYFFSRTKPENVITANFSAGTSVILISGFSSPDSEFYTPYRVHNDKVCNSCWNDPSLAFERENWLWCAKNKDFECSREITFDMVKEKIDLCIQDLSKK